MENVQGIPELHLQDHQAQSVTYVDPASQTQLAGDDLRAHQLASGTDGKIVRGRQVKAVDPFIITGN